MLRSIVKQSEKSVESDRKKKRKATVGMICKQPQQVAAELTAKDRIAADT